MNTYPAEPKVLILYQKKKPEKNLILSLGNYVNRRLLRRGIEKIAKNQNSSKHTMAKMEQELSLHQKEPDFLKEQRKKKKKLLFSWEAVMKMLLIWLGVMIRQLLLLKPYREETLD